MLESFGCGLYTSAAYTRVFTVFAALTSVSGFFFFTFRKKMVWLGDGKRNMLLGCPKQFRVDYLFTQNNVSKIIKNLRGDICRF